VQHILTKLTKKSVVHLSSLHNGRLILRANTYSREMSSAGFDSEGELDYIFNFTADITRISYTVSVALNR